MIGILSFEFSLSWFHALFWKHLSSICMSCFWAWPPNFHFLGRLSMAGGRRYLPAVIASHFCRRSNLAASGYCIQIEMNLDPLGLGVFTTHFKILVSENLDLPFWYVDSKAVSSALRLAPTFLSPRSTWISIIRAPPIKLYNIYYSLIGGAWIIFFELRQSNCIYYITVWLAEPE